MKHEKCVWYLEYFRLKKYGFLFAKSVYFLIRPLGIFSPPLAGMATALFYLMSLIATRIIIIIILHIY